MRTGDRRRSTALVGPLSGYRCSVNRTPIRISNLTPAGCLIDGEAVPYSLARIPKTDWTSRLLQDQIDESMRRQIAHEPPGPRRAFLLRDYELWLANGKPTYYSPGKSAHGREGRKEASAVRTWARGKPAFWDFIDDNERKGERQFLRR